MSQTPPRRQRKINLSQPLKSRPRRQQKVTLGQTLSRVIPKLPISSSSPVDVITNRPYYRARFNEFNAMRMATIQVEQSFCDALNGLMTNKLSDLEKILLREVNENFLKADMQNSIKGTIETIIGDILKDDNTTEILLKHLRSGCFKDENAEQGIARKQQILADLRERDFLNRLNRSITGGDGGGGDDDGYSGGNQQHGGDSLGLEVDSQDAIATAVCDIYKRLFKSWPNSLKSTAVETITRVIKTDTKIQEHIHNMVIAIIKRTFDVAAFREVFITQLEGGCHKQPGITPNKILMPEKEAPATPTDMENAAISPDKVTISKQSIHGGFATATKKNRKNAGSRKTKKHQKGGHQELTHLSFETLAKDAFPNIKACMCDKIKLMYSSATPKVFENYKTFFEEVVQDPVVIEHAKVHYTTFLNNILHSSNTQIKIDLRKHVNGECPPLEDPELKFQE